MHNLSYVERMVDLIDPTANVLLNLSIEEATAAVASGDPERVRQIDGQFAIVYREGKTVRLARSLGRPMRYFLAKQVDGPCLIVAERMDEIYQQLQADGLADQFHPSYTRMVPAHHVVELSLVGCPDPNPHYQRFFEPERNTLSSDLNEIGRAYIGALDREIDRWLDVVDSREPLGVLFSGGIDSGSVLLVLYHRLLQRGESPSRLKAFTLAVDGAAADSEQAHDFLKQADLCMLLEVLDVPAEKIDYRAAIRVTEDYKPLDVQSATMALAACREIRERYPEWKFLIDGDGGEAGHRRL